MNTRNYIIKGQLTLIPYKDALSGKNTSIEERLRKGLTKSKSIAIKNYVFHIGNCEFVHIY